MQRGRPACPAGSPPLGRARRFRRRIRERERRRGVTMTTRPKGTLIIIGGHEEKGADNDREILTEVSKRARRGKKPLLLITVATIEPEEMAKQYTAVFKDLGVPHVDVLDIRSREDACQPEA